MVAQGLTGGAFSIAHIKCSLIYLNLNFQATSNCSISAIDGTQASLDPDKENLDVIKSFLGFITPNSM